MYGPARRCRTRTWRPGCAGGDTRGSGGRPSSTARAWRRAASTRSTSGHPTACWAATGTRSPGWSRRRGSSTRTRAARGTASRSRAATPSPRTTPCSPRRCSCASTARPSRRATRPSPTSSSPPTRSSWPARRPATACGARSTISSRRSASRDPGLARSVYVVRDAMSAVAVPDPARPGAFLFDFTPQAEDGLRPLAGRRDAHGRHRDSPVRMARLSFGMNMERIYLDHNATTPLDPRVLEAMRPWLEAASATPRACTGSASAPGGRGGRARAGGGARGRHARRDRLHERGHRGRQPGPARRRGGGPRRTAQDPGLGDRAPRRAQHGQGAPGSGFAVESCG